MLERNDYGRRIFYIHSLQLDSFRPGERDTRTDRRDVLALQLHKSMCFVTVVPRH